MTEGRLVATAIGVALCWIIGFLLYRIARREDRKCRDSASWLAADGVIESAEMVLVGDFRMPITRPAIAYRYHILGHDLRGDAVHFGLEWTGMDNRIINNLAQLPPGTPVTVWVNPDDLDDCVLVRQKVTRPYWWGACLFGFLGLLIIMGAA